MLTTRVLSIAAAAAAATVGAWALLAAAPHGAGHGSGPGHDRGNAAGPYEITVRWLPQPPSQGGPVHLLVQPDSHAVMPTAVRGALAGQQLHFEPVPGGWHALGGLPVSAPDSAVLTLEVDYDGDDTMHHFVRVPVASGEFAVERLRVDRRYVDAPDSALQERIARERAQSRAVYARSPDTPRLWSGHFARPLPGRVTSRFGTRREFNGELKSRHWGVDLDGDIGDPVAATNRGVVALVGDFYYSGNVVYVDHGRGLITAYLHLSRVDVAQGDTLERGSLVGRVGATGRVTGPHLHWLVRFGGVSLDGLKLLELDVSGFVEPETVPRAEEPVAASR